MNREMRTRPENATFCGLQTLPANASACVAYLAALWSARFRPSQADGQEAGIQLVLRGFAEPFALVLYKIGGRKNEAGFRR